MFEVITAYQLPGTEYELMALRSELSYLIRSKGKDDGHQVSSQRIGDKSIITLKYTYIVDGQYLQDFTDAYIPSDVVIYDKLEKQYSHYWLMDIMEILNIGTYLDGKLYYNLKDMDDDQDNIERYFEMRNKVEDRLEALWKAKWMKGLGAYIDHWPVKQIEGLDDWYSVTEHCDRVMGNFYTFYSNMIRNISHLRFRVPYNFSILYHIGLEYDITVNGGFVTIKDIMSYSDALEVSKTVEEAINTVTYKTADYWGDSINTIQPVVDMRIVQLSINSYQCYLSKIPNVISVEDGRKMIAYMLSDRIKAK